MQDTVITCRINAEGRSAGHGRVSAIISGPVKSTVPASRHRGNRISSRAVRERRMILQRGKCEQGMQGAARAHAKNRAVKVFAKISGDAARRTGAIQIAVHRLDQAPDRLSAVRSPGEIVNDVELRLGEGARR
jgi:hypothetical protein